MMGMVFSSLSLLALGASSALASSDQPIYLVTGATGGTGQLIYGLLRDQDDVIVRALVTNVTKAREYLNCDLCDESEGIYVGDVTNSSSLYPAMEGVTFVADAVGVSGVNMSDATVENVEWKGVENQVSVLADIAVKQGRPVSSLQFAMISSMGTTNPDPQPFMGGNVLFWKLQAEAFLASSGVPFTIVKPCGLSNDAAEQVQLDVAHDDYFMTRQAHVEYGFGTVARGDVARVMAYALTARRAGLRFDLCGTTRKGTTPTTDDALGALLDDAQWPWMSASA